MLPVALASPWSVYSLAATAFLTVLQTIKFPCHGMQSGSSSSWERSYIVMTLSRFTHLFSVLVPHPIFLCFLCFYDTMGSAFGERTREKAEG